MKKTISALLLLLLPGTGLAGDVVVEGARLWAAPDHTRVVFDISDPVQHTLFSLDNPNRIVVDLSDAELNKALSGLDFSSGHVRRIRHARRNGDDLRVVLDLRNDVRPKSFVLKPNRKYGHRLVIDLYDKDGRATTQPVKTDRRAQPGKPRELVIAIDAGHGGEDPGASGHGGTREKDVVLAIARRLERRIRKEPGMRPVMIRDGDYYIGLRKRVAIARRHRADLFISIHADAFRHRSARGASVYALSQRGASSEAARWLADRENASDLVGGVSLDDKDDLLASVLLDLSMTGTIEASLEAGKEVLSELDDLGPVHKRHVGQAGFVVLKSPDIPSILVETAFISNPGEERKLRSARHQERLAAAIVSGVRRYFINHPPQGTLMARQRRHVIARGDTLSEIARRYHVTVEHLRVANGLEHDRIQVGDVLKIPVASGS